MAVGMKAGGLGWVLGRVVRHSPAKTPDWLTTNGVGGWVMQVARKRPVGNRPLRKQGTRAGRMAGDMSVEREVTV